ncbi:hypothetical protein O0544_20875 [Edwardsiella anguillarum]|nr:hypothetical protein [Edwardsiella anguillarum]
MTDSHIGFGSGNVNISASGSFIADTSGSFKFNNKLTGDGQFIAMNNGGNFDFASSVGNEFTGDVLLENNEFLLDGDNTTALENATLHIGNNNITTVGDGIKNIGSISFNGGTLVFGHVSPEV